MFRLPNGTGEARGVEYHSNEGALRLQHDVRFELTPTPSKTAKNKDPEPVQIRGTRLDFDRDAHRMQLTGPAEATTAGSQLKAGNVAVELDESFRARKLVASAGGAGIRPELHSQDQKGARAMNADTMTAMLNAEGKIAGIAAQGNVTGSVDGVEEKEEMASNDAQLDFWPATGRTKEITLRGAARVHTENKKTGEARELQSDAVRMSFSGGKLEEKSRPQMAETLAPGTLVWTNGAGKTAGAGEQTKLQADRLHLDFGDAGKAKLLQASGNVRRAMRTRKHTRPRLRFCRIPVRSTRTEACARRTTRASKELCRLGLPRQISPRTRCKGIRKPGALSTKDMQDFGRAIRRWKPTQSNCSALHAF